MWGIEKYENVRKKMWKGVILLGYPNKNLNNLKLNLKFKIWHWTNFQIWAALRKTLIPMKLIPIMIDKTKAFMVTIKFLKYYCFETVQTLQNLWKLVS